MPESLESILIFFVAAVPAYIALRLFKNYQPIQYYQTVPSTLEQVSLYISLSIVINIVVFIFLIPFLLIIYGVWPGLKILQFPGDIFQLVQFIKISLHILLYTGFSLGVILIGSKYLVPKLPKPTIPLWYEEMLRLVARQKREKTLYLISVSLENGDHCSGYIKRIIWVGNEENSIELTLVNATYTQKGSQTPTLAGRILLKSADIVSLSLYSL